MSRFQSKEEIKKQDNKLKNGDILNTSKYKSDLKEAINKEYHRINVDSAKKKAVVQRMDYDNFHQMVLGADLKGMKAEDIIYVKFDKNEKILNTCKVMERLTKKIDVLDEIMIESEEGEDENSKGNSIKISEMKIDYIQKYKNEILKLESDNYDEQLKVIIEINNQIGIDFYISSIKPIEPNMFSKILNSLLLISHIDLTEISYTNQKNIDSLKDLQIKGMTILSTLENFKNLKIFINKKTKELIKETINSNIDTTLREVLYKYI